MSDRTRRRRDGRGRTLLEALPAVLAVQAGVGEPLDADTVAELDALVLQDGRSLLVVGREGLAVPAPRREELDEHEVLRVYRRAKVGIGEGDDIAGIGGDKAGEQQGRRRPEERRGAHGGGIEGRVLVHLPAGFISLRLTCQRLAYKRLDFRVRARAAPLPCSLPHRV